MYRRSKNLYRFLVFSSFLLSVQGFASWLKCYVDLDEEEIIMKYNVLGSEDAKYNVSIQVLDGSEWKDEYSLKEDGEMISIRLKFPPELPGDTQWVIEIVAGDAQFVERNTMCKGKRAYSKDDKPLFLNVLDSSEAIELLAGYASGHEAVKLTPKQVLTTKNDINSKEEL